MFLLTIPLITGILVIFQQGILGQNVAYTAVFSIACFCLYDIMFSLRDGFVRLKAIVKTGKGGLSGVCKIALHAVMLISLLFVAWQQTILLRSPILNSDILAKTLDKEPWVLASTLISAVWITWHFYRKFVRESNNSLVTIPGSRDVFSVLASSECAGQLPLQGGRTLLGHLKEAWQRWQRESQKTRIPDMNRQFGRLRYFTLYSDELVKIFRGEYSLAGLFWVYGAGVGGVFWGTVVVLFRGMLTLPAELEQNQILTAVVPFLIGCYIAYGLTLVFGLLRVSLRRPKKGAALLVCALMVIVFGVSVYLGFGIALKKYLAQCCSGIVCILMLEQLCLINTERKNYEIQRQTIKGELAAPIKRFFSSLLWGEMPLWFVYWICRSVLYVASTWLSYPVLTIINKTLGTSHEATRFYFFFALYHTISAASTTMIFYADLAIIFTAAKYKGRSLWACLAVIMAVNDSVTQIVGIIESFVSLLEYPRSAWFFSFCYFLVFMPLVLKSRGALGKCSERISQFPSRIMKSLVCAGVVCSCKLIVHKYVQLPLDKADFAYCDGMISCSVGLFFYTLTSLTFRRQRTEIGQIQKQFAARLFFLWNGDYLANEMFWKLGVFFLPAWNWLVNTITLNAGVLLPPYGTNVALAHTWFALVVSVSALIQAIICRGTLIAARRENKSKIEILLMCIYLLGSAEIGLYLPFFDASNLNVLRKQLPFSFPYALPVLLLLIVPLAAVSAFIPKITQRDDCKILEKPLISKHSFIEAISGLSRSWIKGHLSMGVTFWGFTVGAEVAMYVLAEVFYKGVLVSNAQGFICEYVTLFCTFLTIVIGISYPVLATLALIRAIRIHQPRKEFGLVASALALGAMFFWELRVWTYFDQALDQLSTLQLLTSHCVVAAIAVLLLLKTGNSRLEVTLCGGVIMVVLMYDLFFVPPFLEETWFPGDQMIDLAVSYWRSLYFIVEWLFSVIWFRQIVRLSSLRTADRDQSFIACLLCGTYCIVKSSYFSRGGRMILLVSVFLLFFYVEEKWDPLRLKK